jgi:uncharacterized protein
MAGEELEWVDVTARGLRGDRAYALIDRAAGKVGSAKNVKRFGQLLNWRAEFVSSPERDEAPPPVRLTMPDGSSLFSNEPGLETRLAESFGADVSLVSRAPKGLMLEFAAGTLGGAHATTTQLPVSSGAPEGTLYNYAAVHIITTSTLQQLQFASDRFRPNLIVDSGNASGFPENDWIGRIVGVGETLRMRVSIPCPRCVVTTLPRKDLPEDPVVLRTIAQMNTVNLGNFGDLPCVGVYADVIQPGRIRRGDRVVILD